MAAIPLRTDFQKLGLRLLEEQQKQAELQLEAMRAAIAAGLASGPSISGDQIFDRLEKNTKP